MSAEGRPSREARNLALAIRRQKRVVLLFVFAILLPAAALGFFGLRALEADQFRIQQLLKREQEEALRQAAGRVRLGIAALLDELRRLAQGAQPGQIPGTLMRVSSSGDFSFLRERYRFRAQERDPRATAEGREILDAEKLEFGSRSLPDAATRYARLSRNEDPYLRSLALVGLARVFRGMGRPEESLAAYHRLLHETPEELEHETAAHALMAGLQIAAVHRERGEGEKALPDLLSAYHLLLKKRWIVSAQIFGFYARELERDVEELCRAKAPPTCAEFQEIRAARQHRLSEIESLEGLHALLQRTLTEWGRSPLPPKDLVLDFSETRMVVVAVRADAQVLALAVGDQALADLILGPGAVPPETGVSLQLTNERGDVLHGGGMRPAGGTLETMTLGEGLPRWTVAAFHGPASLPFTTRRNLYLGLTAVLALWLLFGALLTARSLRQEMEIVSMKAEFVSLVSHEFKNPITSLRALLDGLRGGAVTDPGRARHYLDVASAELQRLTRLVNNLLDFSRIDAGTRGYRLIPTDLDALLQDLLVPFETRAAELGFRVETAIAERLPEVPVDRDAISQAVLNLLDNAVKNSRDEKWIGIRLAADSRYLVLEVSDRGRGLRPEEIQAILDKSYPAGEEGAAEGRGLGLGIPIVQHVMDSHRGRVEVRSEPGKGSTFRLLIPMSPTKQDEQQADSPG